MLRRDSSHRLDRRKSTSSVQSTHDSINLETARHHAHTAAMLAFLRAQQRSSTDSGHANASSKNNVTSHASSQRESLPPQNATQDGNRVVRRQQSVRFVGPNGLEKRESLKARRSQATIQPQLSSATLGPMAITTDTPVPAAYRPPSRSSSIGKASVHKVAEGLMAANAFKEYYTQEDDVASTPSSYRRIRRSKSMFSPLKAPSIFYTNGSPRRPDSVFNGQHIRSHSHTPTTQPRHHALRAPKSMGVLDGCGQSNERNEPEIQKARDRFFRENNVQRLREQPSFLFRSRAQKQERPFRKSLRTSSTNSYGVPTAASPTGETKQSTLKVAAHRMSRNIKDKLRRVFRRSKEDHPVTIPNQQVEARETHVRHYNGDPQPEQFEGFSDIPHPDESALSRVASRLPSIHTAASNQQLRSHAGSVKSMKSDYSDDKSRITVINSGANTSQSDVSRAPVERDHQRLSVINEVGTHHPSSSYYRAKYKYMNQCSAYPRLDIPEDSRIPPPAPSTLSLIPPDISKNLVRRRRGSEESQISVKRPLAETLTMTDNDNTPTTIRQVLPSQSSYEWSQSSTGDDVFSPMQQSINHYLNLPGDAGGLSPQKMADRNEHIKPDAKVVRESRSTFFGGKSYTISRKTSPFRQVMAEVKQQSISDTFQLADNAQITRNPLYMAPHIKASASMGRQVSSESDLAYSESVYSRTTSGRTPAAANSAISLPILSTELPDIALPQPITPGDVVIIDRTVYRPSGPYNVGHHASSSASSQDWKTWMSSEVGKIERVKENKAGQTFINYALPSMPKSFRSGHVREGAQMNDDDVQVGQGQSPPVYQPLGIISQVSPNIQVAPLKPILKKGIPAPPPLPPAIPPRSPLRDKLSKASLKSQNSSDNGRMHSAPNSASSKKLHKRRLSGASGDIQNSQRMVENFLTTRRKRIASDSDDVAGAFL